ncbi:hypothetical protein Tco_0557455, partial [Tanacetum coccineum]
SYLDDGLTCREMVDEFTPPKFYAIIRVREHDDLFMDAVVTSVKVHNDNLSDQVHTLKVSSAGTSRKSHG